MKAQAKMRAGALSVLVGLFLTGTTCGASPTVTTNQTPDAAPAEIDNPEMKAAEERVGKAQSQLDLAKKQLSAARSLLKAAEADLKAAKADRDSVAMRYAAQNMAEQAGMPTQAGRAVATPAPQTQTPAAVTPPDSTPRTQIADRSGVPAPAASEPVAAAPTTDAAPATTPASPQSMDYNALPQQNEADPPPPLMLR